MNKSQNCKCTNKNTEYEQYNKEKNIVQYKEERNIIEEQNAEIIKKQPTNYSFEIPKTQQRQQQNNVKRVGQQFPEGQQIFAPTISDILEKYGGVEVFIQGDVTYGACCIDDYTATSVQCDFLVHYGHSCLLPINIMDIPTMYVFVSITFETQHFIDIMKMNFKSDINIILSSTIQFQNILENIRKELQNFFINPILIPQIKPLSSGEVLGCTSPNINNMKKQMERSIKVYKLLKKDIPSNIPPIEQYTTCIFIADGRFHLESLMIHNPQIKEFYRYNPYNKIMTRESYDLQKMQNNRYESICIAREAKCWGIVLSTLGRQGSLKQLDNVENILKLYKLPYIIVQSSEILVDRINTAYTKIDAWVQIACPRLSIDWGTEFTKPFLNLYEFNVCFHCASWLPNSIYPMDYYSDENQPWSALG